LVPERTSDRCINERTGGDMIQRRDPVTRVGKSMLVFKV